MAALYFSTKSATVSFAASQASAVLEDQVIRRVGGIRDMQVDVRVIAASNRDSKKPSAKASSPGSLLPPRHYAILSRRCATAKKTLCPWSSSLLTATTPIQEVDSWHHRRHAPSYLGHNWREMFASSRTPSNAE